MLHVYTLCIQDTFVFLYMRVCIHIWCACVRVLCVRVCVVHVILIILTVHIYAHVYHHVTDFGEVHREACGGVQLHPLQCLGCVCVCVCAHYV